MRRVIALIIVFVLQGLWIWYHWPAFAEFPWSLAIVGLFDAGAVVFLWLTRPSKVGRKVSRQAARIYAVTCIVLAGLLYLFIEIVNFLAAFW
ncbi:MAG: hypothetical protein L0241_10770 [Planctomycetia bacterium]|nr:hypothetical protein [Planctomycetia bacterium]